MKSRAIFWITGLVALLISPVQLVAAGSLEQLLAKRKPEATIDLTIKEGAQVVRGEWRYSDTQIIEVDFKAPGPDGQPTGATNKAYDFTPHAGAVEFDDSKWEVIDPPTLDKHRSAGKLAFSWYNAGLGHLSEIAAADPPHTPRGCPFQAWSLGELLRLDRVVLAFPENQKVRASSRA